jgi:hypothetical protein
MTGSTSLAGIERLHRAMEARVSNGELMTSNHLTPGQQAGGGPVLSGRGWGFGMAVATTPDAVSAVPGRYGWEGGHDTAWFNHPAGA